MRDDLRIPVAGGVPPRVHILLSDLLSSFVRVLFFFVFVFFTVHPPRRSSSARQHRIVSKLTVCFRRYLLPPPLPRRWPWISLSLSFYLHLSLSLFLFVLVSSEMFGSVVHVIFDPWPINCAFIINSHEVFFPSHTKFAHRRHRNPSRATSSMQLSCPSRRRAFSSETLEINNYQQ